MIKDFNYEKACAFMEKTQQPIFILKGANNINKLDIYELVKLTLDVDINFESNCFLRYYNEEQLYCKLLKANNYYLPYTFAEMRYCFAKINQRLRKIKFGSYKYRQIRNLVRINKFAFDCVDCILRNYPRGI